MTDSRTVLGIPVPTNARALAGTPPYPSHHCDIIAPELITTFGKRHFTDPHEVRYETQLSYGLSDIVILLERPYVKSYRASFDMIVQTSNTLRAVDELVRFSSRGVRSIYTVTVLNTFPMQPAKNKNRLDGECHGLVAQVLQAKKPKIVLRCDQHSFCSRMGG